MIYQTNSPSETTKLGQDLVKDFAPGLVILSGDLGLGKTTFIKGLALGLGIENQITSPTFVLMKVYPVQNHPTIKKLIHIDAYRLENFSELVDLGLEDWLHSGDSLIVMEWGEKFEKDLEKYNPVKIIFKEMEREKREIEVFN